jgi:hypothetical protein
MAITATVGTTSNWCLFAAACSGMQFAPALQLPQSLVAVRLIRPSIHAGCVQACLEGSRPCRRELASAAVDMVASACSQLQWIPTHASKAARMPCTQQRALYNALAVFGRERAQESQFAVTAVNVSKVECHGLKPEAS